MERSPVTSRRRRRTRQGLGAAIAVVAAGAMTVTGLVSSAEAADVNVAKNAGFESGLANWTCSAGSGTTVSSPVHGGASALRPPRPARTTPSARRPWP